MDYMFQADDEAPRSRTWIVIVALVVSATIGAVLVLRAADRGKAKGGASAASAAEAAPGGGRQASPRGGGLPKPPPVVAEHAAAKPASGAVMELVGKGQDAERRDDLSAARAAYEEALASPECGDARALVESRLGDVFVKLVMSRREMPEKADHAIAPGDLVAKLARKYGTTAELVAKANGISNPNNIKVGDRLRILDHAKFEIAVSKSQNWLLVTMNGKFFKRYTVGTGQYNRTPVGTFRISDKIREPNWWKDGREIPYGDKENILGTRWMAISATGATPPAKGYGIHGTWDNSTLGRQSSAGCVRMANEDVEELFAYIPDGTDVVISE